jgi:hypothetical protein
MDDALFLYPAKAAAGPCTRLARCGGRGFLMRACRLVVYSNNILYISIIKTFIKIIDISKSELIDISISKLIFFSFLFL